MRNLAKVCVILFGTALLAGCNTVEGAGKDVESGGEAVQDSAKSVQKKL